MAKLNETQRSGKLTLEYAMTGRSLAFYRESENLLPQKDGLDGFTKVAMILSVGVITLAEAYNIGKNLNNNQMADIAEAILTEYPTLKLAEFVYFINRAKTGRYGKAFDRLDMPTVFEWLDKFFEEREEVLERKRLNQKAAHEVSDMAAGNIFAKLAEKEPAIADLLQKATEDSHEKEVGYHKFKLERLKNQQSETHNP